MPRAYCAKKRPALTSPKPSVGFIEGVSIWTLPESYWLSYAWPVLPVLLFELGHCGSVGPAYWSCSGSGALTYAATRPMIFLACRAPRFSTEEGKFFLVNGNEVRRLRSSELRTWLLEDELRVTEKNLKSYRKICVVRTHEVIGPLHNARPGYQTLRSDVR